MGVSRVLILGLVVCLLDLLGGCQSPNVSSPAGSTAAASVDRPLVTPSGGRFADASVLVSLSAPSVGALIFYTDDGTTPTTSSNRYTAPFRVFGSTLQIRAISVLGDQISPVAVASFVLNDGRAANQMGLVTGSIELEDPSLGIPLDSVNIFSDDLPGTVVHPDSAGTFVFDGLDTSKAYDFFFTNQDLGPVVGQTRSLARATGTKPIVAIRVHKVQPAAGAGVKLNKVKLKKPGAIVGKALRYGKTSQPETDNTGIDVYVPGTAFNAKTDSAGNFVIAGVPEGSYTLRAEKAGYTYREVTSVVVTSGQTADLSAEPLSIYYGYGTVTGTARLTDGSTDSLSSDGVLVLLRNQLDSTTTVPSSTGPDGVFTVPAVEPGIYTAYFSKTGFVSQSVADIAVQGAQIKNLGSITLGASGGKLSGRVTIRGAVDFAGTMIVAKNDGSGKVFSSATLSDGTYTLDPVLPGSYSLQASHAGYTTRNLSQLVVGSGVALTNVDLPELVPAAGTLTGIVRLDGASTFEGIGVTIVKSSDPTVTATTLTASDGSWVLSNVTPGTYLVRFAKDGFLSGPGTSLALLDDGIATAATVVLSSSKAKLSGTVTLEGKSDYSGVAILASSPAGKTASTVTDATGRFALVGLDPDTYTVQATKDGFVTALSDPQVLGAAANTGGLTLNLAVASRSVVGKVTLEGLADFAGVSVTATNLAAPTTSIFSALSNSQGYYVLAGLVPGEYLVSYSKPNYKGYTSNTVSLVGNSMATLPDLLLNQARGSVAGLALLQGRTGQAGTVVTLVGTSFTTTTAADGSYSFLVPSGNYPGGVRYEHSDFQTTMNTGTVTVLTDSTYGVATVTLAATANTVSGTINLVGTSDDGGIAVSIDGLSGFSATTAADGTWHVDHVPLGTYVFRFSRAMTPDVTTTVAVAAADVVSVPNLDMVPNSATLKGWVTLAGLSDASGISIRVTTSGQPDLTTTTNASGAFEIGSVLTTGSHTFEASKAGWVTYSTTVTGLTPLEVRTLGGLGSSIALTDMLAPAVNSVTINSGSAYTNDKVLTLTLDVIEQGSGSDQMQLQLNSSPTSPNWEPYHSNFTKDMSMFSLVYGGNGTYSVGVRVKDKAGNVSGWTTHSITLTDQQHVVNGVLPDSELHWTAALSPYRVESNLLVPSGKTLVIDAGVEVRFAGNYYMMVSGNIAANGSSAQPIVFTTASDFSGKWNGIQIGGGATPLAVANRATYQSGPLFQWVTFRHASAAFHASSGLWLQNCTLDSTNTAALTYYDTAGNIATGSFAVYMNDSNISSGIPTWGWTDSELNLVNSQVHDINVNFMSRLKAYNTTFTNVSGITFWHNFGAGSVFQNCNFEAMTSGISTTDNSIQVGFPFSNLEGFSGNPILSTALLASQTAKSDLRWVYWGAAQIEEMESQGAATNLLFIHDYYDDFNLAELVYSPWASTRWASAGYQGAAYVDLGLSAVKATATTATVTVTPFTATALSQVKFAQSPLDLAAAAWTTYASTKTVTYSAATTVNGLVELYAQAKDANGNVSGVVVTTFAP